jgi:hypothetical protein
VTIDKAATIGKKNSGKLVFYGVDEWGSQAVGHVHSAPVRALEHN